MTGSWRPHKVCLRELVNISAHKRIGSMLSTHTPVERDLSRRERSAVSWKHSILWNGFTNNKGVLARSFKLKLLKGLLKCPHDRTIKTYSMERLFIMHFLYFIPLYFVFLVKVN